MSQDDYLNRKQHDVESSGWPVWLKWGLITGALQIAFVVIQYVIDPALMIAWWNSLLSIGLLVALMVGAAMEYRDREGGWMSYGTSVWLMFRVCMLGSLLSVAFMGLLYNVIDKGLDERMKEITLEQMEQMLEKFDVPSEQIEEQMEAIEERDFSQTPRALITSWMISVVFGLFLALIASAFTKKNEPLFIDESTSTHE
jgi:FtsH-binding integral membrane protein